MRSVVPRSCVYEDAPKPEPKPGELLVRVHAVGLNPPDWYLREGYRNAPPEWQPEGQFPHHSGNGHFGRGRGGRQTTSRAFAVGDEVYAMVRFPSGVFGDSKAYAEYVSVPASEIALKPAGIDHVHAAGAPMSLLTAWQFMVELGHDEPNPLPAEQASARAARGQDRPHKRGRRRCRALRGANRQVEGRPRHRGGVGQA